MTIYKDESLFLPELRTKFKVLNVQWDPHADSTWELQYKDIVTFFATSLDTKEEDEALFEVEAHIKIFDGESEFALKEEKSVLLKDGSLEFTGIITDEIKYFTERKGQTVEYITYKLDSVFPLEAGDCPENVKIGDWVTVNGCIWIYLPDDR